MLSYLATTFDYTRYPPRAIESVLISDGKIKSFILFKPKSGLKIKKIYENIDRLRDLISGKIILNDYKAHLYLLGETEAKVYESGIRNTSFQRSDLIETMKQMKKIEPVFWRRQISRAMEVYWALEQKEVKDGYKKMKPIYDLTTFTGRSKTTRFNIQGANEEFDINVPDITLDTFVHFDWVAADFRMASIISQDQEMEEIFKTEDPYETIIEILNVDIERDDLKLDMLKSLYMVKCDEPIFTLFPKFVEWMGKRITKIQEDHKHQSILGRQFFGRSDRAIFNATIQGSIAHAMQSVIVKVFEQFGRFLLTEVHDSIILVCPENDVKMIIDGVVKIMNYPFEDILDQNPIFPVRVSIGKKWKRWKKFKVFK